MSSLNSLFKEAIIEHNYRHSMFDGKKYDIDELQICHILSKSKRTLNCIKKAYNCDDKIANILMNMPLLNTVVGTRQDNAEYKKTDDICRIDASLCDIAQSVIELNISYRYDDLFNIKVFCKMMAYLSFFCNSDNIMDITSFIKNIQYQFHKEIDLHF